MFTKAVSISENSDIGFVKHEMVHAFAFGLTSMESKCMLL